MNRQNILSLFGFIIGCELIGGIGGLFTMNEITSWYATLTKAPLNPPSWIFGPVWTLLYALMGVSVFFVWQKRKESSGSGLALRMFCYQLILNFFWSIQFFALHNPFLALIDIVLLWIAILLTIIYFSKISRVSAYLLVPYILWVSFATYINYMLYILN